MKFSASSAALLKALTTTGGAVPAKSTLPILECILFEQVDDKRLSLSATDLEVTIVQQVEVQFESASARRIAVPARRLLDTLRALPEVPISFEANEEFQIVLTTDAGEYKMSGHDGGDYPSLPDMDPEHTIETSGDLVRRAIEKTSFAVSKDALRPAMMGVYFQIGPEPGRAVATDGHRLVRMQMDSMTSDEEANFIIPEKALSLANKILSGETCVILVDAGYACFDAGDTRILVRLIAEAYPNYEAVIPKDNDKQIVVERNALLAAVKRVSLYSSNLTPQIKLMLHEDHIKIEAQDIERSSEAHETVPCEYNGESMPIGFNATYLNEVLGHIDDDEVVIEFSSPNRAGVVTPQTQRDGEHVLMLIMPVMLNH